MSVWLLRQALTPGNETHIFERADLTLPFGDLPDLTHLSSPQEARKMLALLYPGDPPESIAHRLDRFWQQFTGLQVEDLIVVPLPLSQQVVIAEVSGHYHYQAGDKGDDVHLIPVRWYDKRIPMAKLRKHKEIFNESNPPLFEIISPEARTAIRDHLPHGYNRFAKFKWLLGVLFALGLVQMVMRWAH